jgi:hypothetical protein
VNHTSHIPGSPVQPGERVTIVTTIDADVADLSHHIGRSGVVVHLNYDCGCSQQYPGDPMIGVRLDLDAARTPGEVEEFWAEELGRKAVRVDPSDTAPRLHIPADLLTRPAGGGVR